MELAKTILIVALIVIAGVLAFGSKNYGAPALINPIIGSATASSSTVSTTASLSVNVNAGRVYLQLSNDGSNTVYCQPATSTGLAANIGWRLATAGNLTFKNDGVMFNNSLYCITATGTSTLSIIEK